jgi:Flp pilus assembly CpaF family ATPase
MFSEILKQGKRVGDDSEFSPLTFEVDNRYPAESLKHQGNFFVSGNVGKQCLYSFYAPRLNKGDMDIAGKVKAKCVSMALGYDAEHFTIDAVSSKASELLSTYRTSAQKEAIAYLIAHDVAGHGPISMLMDSSKEMEEIVINSPRSFISLYHPEYGYCQTNLRFVDENYFKYTINRLIEKTDRELGPESPIIDAQLEDGSRLHAQLRPYSINGAAASIRLNGFKTFGLKELITMGGAAPEVFAYLWMAIDSGLNIVISGAPSSGKTTMLNAINAFIPRYSRVITIEEDVNELRPGPHFINFVSLQGSSDRSKVQLRDQVINALHLRPDRLIVGELRGDETREVFFGSNIGVPFITTMHSSAGGMAIINRLQAKPMSVQPENLCLLDLGIFMQQSGLSSRSVSSIDEFRWLARDELLGDAKRRESPDRELQVCPVFREGKLLTEYLSNSKVIRAYALKNLKTARGAMEELKRRTGFLTDLQKAGNGMNVVTYMESYGDRS